MEKGRTITATEGAGKYPARRLRMKKADSKHNKSSIEAYSVQATRALKISKKDLALLRQALEDL
ncbi:MAG: hypothetical protein P4L67_02460, partial [Candidatus Pacebacteria bacterium]|nr:hypothetical protein [Candidatus Paceibacterota bacterium]